MIPCERCKKSQSLCVCDQVSPQATRLHVLILQHPQEPDHELGSGLLTHLMLPNSTLNIGLSWRNLAAALNQKDVNPTRWAVLYLGSGVKATGPIQTLQFVTNKGQPIERPDMLDGIVVLDGTWSQAKTLWWRNAWLLKLRRVILTPQQRSLYKELRIEPRRECLSTIESVAETLDALGEKPEVGVALKKIFVGLLEKYTPRESFCGF